MKLASLVSAVRRVHPLDWLLLAVAAAFSAVTLFYPYGRDQGLYHYVGREWFLGAMPYRDTMDQKTPVIYALFGFANLIFGEHLWSIRVLELLWVLSFGWLFAAAAGSRVAPALPGVRGTGSLLICLLYFGVLGYWDTAQCEIWYAGSVFLSLASLERAERSLRSSLVAGLWAGLACLAKPPAVLLVFVVLFALLTREWLAVGGESVQTSGRARARRVGSALGCFGLGAAVPTLATILYFGASGALSDFYDVVVLCNAYYRLHERPALDFAVTLDQLRDSWLRLYPLSLFSNLAVLTGLCFALRLRSLVLARRYLIAALLPLAGIAAVLLQGLYFPYHWGAAYVGYAAALIFGLYDVALHVPPLFKRPLATAWLTGVLSFLLFVGYTSSGETAAGYTRNIKATLSYLRGDLEREAFMQLYNIPNFYDLVSNVAVADWLAAHSAPEDLVAVRGFEPAIYALARRTSDLRFFWTSWLTGENRAYRREQWLAQDEAQIKELRPRFVVALLFAGGGPDSIVYFHPYGTWQERMRAGGLVVYERVSNTPTALAPTSEPPKVAAAAAHL